MSRVIIFGGKRKNACQEQDLVDALQRKGIESTIWGKKELLSGTPGDTDLFFIRNLFYSSIDDHANPENSRVIKQLRELEESTTFLNTIDGLLAVRDKLAISRVYRDLRIPFIKAEKLTNDPNELVKWVDEASERYSTGVIIKDQYGGLGKGIIKIKKQGTKYLCDVSCVVDGEQKFTNESWDGSELKVFFKEHMGDLSLMGQAYVSSEYEFREPGKSESIRLLDIGQNQYLAMARRATGAINNVSLTKSGEGDISEASIPEMEVDVSKRICEHLGLFFAGCDFIRTDTSFFRGDPQALYVPADMRASTKVSFMLEINGIPQYGGIQELYTGKCSITDLIVDEITKYL